MSLTTAQQAFLDEFDTNAAAFRGALVAALEADNDGSTELGDARTLRNALNDTHVALVKNLGFAETTAPTIRPSYAAGSLPRSGSLGNVWFRNAQPFPDARIVPQ